MISRVVEHTLLDMTNFSLRIHQTDCVLPPKLLFFSFLFIVTSSNWVVLRSILYGD